VVGVHPHWLATPPPPHVLGATHTLPEQHGSPALPHATQTSSWLAVVEFSQI
jgi:hypothetical protein